MTPDPNALHQVTPHEWYIARHGSTKGPFPGHNISAWVQSGALTSADLLWRSDWPGWKPVSEVFNLTPQLAPPPLPPPVATGTASGTALADRGLGSAGTALLGGNIVNTLALIAPVAGAIAGVLDFMKPLTESVFGLNGIGAYFWAGVIGAPLCLYLKRLGHFTPWREKLGLASSVCAVMAVMGSYPVIGGWISPAIDQKGVIAAHLPSAASAQQLMLEKIGIDTREIAATTKRIEDKVGMLKRETSEDPRKELTNLGIPWSGDGFWQALGSGDKRVIGLFMKAGYRIDPQTTVMFVQRWFDPDLAKIMAAHKVQFDQEVCTEDSRPDPFQPYRMYLQSQFLTDGLNTPEKKAFFYSICDPAALRAKYQRKLGDDAAAARAAACIARVKQRHSPAAAAARNIDFKPLEAVWKEAFVESGDGQGRPLAWGPQAEAAWKNKHQQLSNLALMMSGRVNQPILLDSVAKSACDLAYANSERVSGTDRADVQKILAVLPPK